MKDTIAFVDVNDVCGIQNLHKWYPLKIFFFFGSVI